MKKILFLLVTLSINFVLAADKIKMNFVNEEIPLIIEHYAKESGTRFIVDSTVRGKISILNQDKVTLEEAYNQLSEALAINGFAILKKEDYSIIRNARSVQRDGIDVYINEVPSLRPQRMATWVVTLKSVSARELQQNIGRLLNSSYGELQVYPEKNQLVVTDFTSSINRIAKMVLEMDKAPAAAVKPMMAIPAKPMMIKRKVIEKPEPAKPDDEKVSGSDVKKAEVDEEK